MDTISYGGPKTRFESYLTFVGAMDNSENFEDWMHVIT